MVLIFGPACQGKLDYLMHNFPDACPPERVFTCSENSAVLDCSASAVNHLHLYLLACLDAGLDPEQEIQKRLSALSNTVILCDEIGSGVVPCSARERAWREANGRVLRLLAQKSQKVIRVFCGIGMVLKDA